jgi:hypothetical protein
LQTGPWTPSPLFFFPEHLLCSASPLPSLLRRQCRSLGCRSSDRRRPPRAGLASARRHLRVLALLPSSAASLRARHGVPSRPPAATSPPPILCPRLPSRLSSSAQPDQEDTETSFALFSLHRASSPPAKHWLPWAATSKRSSPPSPPLRASLTPTRAHRPPIVPQFRPELLTDDRRPPPSRPHRGTLVSGPPRPRLSPSRASPPRPEAIRPLSRYLRPPEYLPTVLPRRRPQAPVAPPLRATPTRFRAITSAQETLGAPPPLCPRRRQSPSPGQAGQLPRPLP